MHAAEALRFGAGWAGAIHAHTYSNGSNYIGYTLSGGNFSTFSVPGDAGFTNAYGINDSGQIVGIINPSGGGFAFLDAGGIYTILATPSYPYTTVQGINDSGVIVGRYNAQNVPFHGMVVSGGTYSGFDVPSAIYSRGFGINSAGQIVGQYSNTSNHGFVGGQGFLYD